MHSGDESCLVSVTFFIRNFLSENYMKKRKILSSGMQLPFFVNAQFWASGDNLDLKYPTNSCKQAAFATGVQKKPKHCREFT